MVQVALSPRADGDSGAGGGGAAGADPVDAVQPGAPGPVSDRVVGADRDGLVGDLW